MSESCGALRETGEFLQLVLDSARMGWWQWDLSTGMMTSDARCKSLLGLSPEAELRYEQFLAMIHPEDRCGLEAEVARAMSGPGDYESEFRVRTPDGSTCWLHAKGRSIAEGGENPTRLMGIIWDVTQRKLAEERARRKQAALPGILHIFREALICETEKALGRVCLAVTEEVTQSKFSFIAEIDRQTGTLEYLAGNDRDGELCWIAGPSQHGSSASLGCDIDGICRRVLLDGKAFLTNDPPSRLECLGAPAGHPALTAFLVVPLSHAGETLGVLGLGNREGGYGAEDLEMAEALALVIVQAFLGKRAEDALRRSEQKFRGIAERSFDAIFTSDHQGYFTYLSSAIERILGYTSNEMVDRHFTEFLAEGEVPRVLHLFSEAMQGRYAETLTIEVVKKDGSHAHLEVSHSRIFDNGSPVGIQGLIRDVTERKRTEDALHREQRLLKHLLELHERERRLISYEVHDGLAQCIFAAQMMLQALEPRLELLPDNAQNSFRQALRLLNHSGMEARMLISHLRPPILDESGVLAAIAYLIAEHSVSATANIELQHEGAFEDLAAPLQAIVFRIVQEGLSNACRHSQSQKIRVALARHPGVIRVEVRDWGCGFDPSLVQENHFGLEGIRERARLFGGKALIETAPGQGTCITVELPE